jgi:hypothetical protein
MVRFYFIASCIALLSGLPGRADAGYETNPNYRSVLDAHHIKVTGSGYVDVPFHQAALLFGSDDLLQSVQDSYERLLPEGETPEFVIETLASNQWTFVNKQAQTSIIEEIHRDAGSDETIRVIYFSMGRRFFGYYRSVVDVVIQRDTNSGESRYDVTVFAYPQNAFMRFFARHLGAVERFFHSKTDEITELSVNICRDLAMREDPGIRID